MSARAVWLSLVVGLALVLAPFALVVAPPLQDMPNHLARIAILAANGADVDLSRFYAIEWVAIPNLALDLVAPPLARLLGVDVAGKLFVAAALVLVVLGPFAIQRARRGSIGLAPMFGLVIAHNEILAIGLVNYQFGVGLALFGVAAWIALDRRPLVRALVGLGFAVATYFCHVMAAGLFGLGVAAIELGRLVERPESRSPRVIAGRAWPTLLAFAALPLLFAMSPSAGLGRGDGIMWTLLGKEIGLVIALRAYEGLAEWIVWIGLAAFVGLALARRAIRLDATTAILLALSILAYVAAPRAIFDGWLVDQRLPHGMIAMLLGFARVEVPSARGARAVAGALLALVAVRAADVAMNWRAIDQTTRAFRAAIEPLPRGTTIGVLLADAPKRSILADATLHLAGHAVVTRSALVSSLFAERGKQVVQVRPPWNARVHPGDIWPPTLAEFEAGAYAFTREWPTSMDAIVVLHETATPRAPVPGWSLRASGPGFAIWRRAP
jgi:hypothetical protein